VKAIRNKRAFLILAAGGGAAAIVTGQVAFRQQVGRQPDGSFIVSTGQSVIPGTIAFPGRPIDIALHPGGEFYAVLNEGSVFLATRSAVISGSVRQTIGTSSYRGCIWSPSGQSLFVSLDRGIVQRLRLNGKKLEYESSIRLLPAKQRGNPVPGGMCITRDGSRLYVACANNNSVAEVDVATNSLLRHIKVQNTPFEARLNDDETKLIVTNWAGRDPRQGEERAESGESEILVDKRGIPISGTVSLCDLRSGRRKDIAVGLHPCGIAIRGDKAYIANAGSDTISEVDVSRGAVSRTFAVRRGFAPLYGSMPTAVAVNGDRLYACCGGDNAIWETDLRSGGSSGFRPAGHFPVGIQISTDGKTAYVVNAKGNGSVLFTARGLPGNVHQFQGTVSVVDLTADLAEATRTTAMLSRTLRLRRPPVPRLAVYRGAIKHVLYIIKENRTYDQVLGDLPQGNGSARLCLFGQDITPNHHAIAREFALFDNAYATGTNSAEGHQWAVEGLANDYIERFYKDYTRGFPFDGGDAMAYASSGFIWDAAVRRGLSVRVYGEFCKAKLASITPRPKDWLEAWKDRASGANAIKVRAGTTIAGLKKLIHPNVIGWPLIMSDQWRADRFIEEYRRFSQADRVPNLMILTLPADHTEGFNPGYPVPRSMIADNDLALGRVLEAVSKSPQWKDPCVFVMEDEAQYGLDHVDGHRTVCFVASPYIKRGVVDSTLYTQPSILRSIELMLGLQPMNRFDAVATPFAACFDDSPDLTPYTARPNTYPLVSMNRPFGQLSGQRLQWAKISVALDWDDVDSADWKTLSRLLWFDVKGNEPYAVTAE
jgi:YVTN family beta-propeller protein